MGTGRVEKLSLSWGNISLITLLCIFFYFPYFFVLCRGLISNTQYDLLYISFYPFDIVG